MSQISKGIDTGLERRQARSKGFIVGTYEISTSLEKALTQGFVSRRGIFSAGLLLNYQHKRFHRFNVSHTVLCITYKKIREIPNIVDGRYFLKTGCQYSNPSIYSTGNPSIHSISETTSKTPELAIGQGEAQRQDRQYQLHYFVCPPERCTAMLLTKMKK